MRKPHYLLTEFKPVRYFQKFIKPRILFGNKGYVKRHEISLTNMCDKNCYSCSTLCDKPIGSNTFRDKPTFQSIEGINAFLKEMKNYGNDYWIRLVGGEPTFPNDDYLYLEKISDLCRKYGYKLDILTNGFKIVDHNPFIFDFIHLDYHGDINAKQIDDAITYFNKVGYKHYNVQPTFKHFNIQEKIGYPTMGLRCPEFMKSLTLWRNVVYPCCVSPFLDGWFNTNELRESLIKAGWTVYTENLSLIIQNWITTLPNTFHKYCNIKCWRNDKKAEWVDIDGNSD